MRDGLSGTSSCESGAESWVESPVVAPSGSRPGGGILSVMEIGSG